MKNKDPKKQAAQLVGQLREIFGDRIESAIIYGSVARDEYIEGVSDINVMILFDQLDATTLAAASPVARRWFRDGHTPPLIIEEEQWRRATDVFAIELADMRDAHIPILGEDVVANEELHLPELRIQAERELRGKLLQLQTGMLMGAEERDGLGKLLQKALPSFVTYLRAALRLAGREPARSSETVIREGMALVGGSADPFLEVWNTRVQRRALRAAISDPIVDAYHTAAEQIAVFIDTYGGK